MTAKNETDRKTAIFSLLTRTRRSFSHQSKQPPRASWQAATRPTARRRRSRNFSSSTLCDGAYDSRPASNPPPTVVSRHILCCVAFVCVNVGGGRISLTMPQLAKLWSMPTGIHFSCDNTSETNQPAALGTSEWQSLCSTTPYRGWTTVGGGWWVDEHTDVEQVVVNERSVVGTYIEWIMHACSSLSLLLLLPLLQRHKMNGFEFGNKSLNSGPASENPLALCCVNDKMAACFFLLNCWLVEILASHRQ